MTHDFRRTAYDAVKAAEDAHANPSTILAFEAGPGTFKVTLADLKTLLRNDRKARRERK